MNPAEHYAAAERLLDEGSEVLQRIAIAADDERLAEPGDEAVRSRSRIYRDELGLKVMGIWAQAQVHATLAAVDPDTARLAPKRPALPVTVPPAL